MLVSVASIDKFDSSTFAVDRSDEEFSTIEASLYQVLRSTATNEPLTKVQQTTRTAGTRCMARDCKGMAVKEFNDAQNYGPHAELYFLLRGIRRETGPIEPGHVSNEKPEFYGSRNPQPRKNRSTT